MAETDPVVERAKLVIDQHQIQPPWLVDMAKRVLRDAPIVEAAKAHHRIYQHKTSHLQDCAVCQAVESERAP